MNRLFEYTANHPLLTAAAAILAVLVVVIEGRHRARGASALGPNDVVQLVNSGALVLDVRDSKDYETGHIIDARSIPSSDLANRADGLKKFKDKPVVVYCETGFTSGAAARTLRTLGFGKVVTLRGGLSGWRQDNLPLVKGAARKDGKQA
jgi:rhodanese-related sulfurtransferase